MGMMLSLPPALPQQGAASAQGPPSEHTPSALAMSAATQSDFQPTFPLHATAGTFTLGSSHCHPSGFDLTPTKPHAPPAASGVAAGVPHRAPPVAAPDDEVQAQNRSNPGQNSSVGELSAHQRSIPSQRPSAAHASSYSDNSHSSVPPGPVQFGIETIESAPAPGSNVGTSECTAPSEARHIHVFKQFEPRPDASHAARSDALARSDTGMRPDAQSEPSALSGVATRDSVSNYMTQLATLPAPPEDAPMLVRPLPPFVAPSHPHAGGPCFKILGPVANCFVNIRKRNVQQSR